MPIIPRTQSDLSSLAQSIIAGVSAHPEDFPHVDIAPYQAKRDHFLQASADFTDAQAQANLAAEEKENSFKDLEAATRNILKMIFADTAQNPEKLAEIGWGSRRDAQSIAPPASPTALVVTAVTGDTVILSWKKPLKKSGGGPVRSYKIERKILSKQMTEDGEQITDNQPIEDWTFVESVFKNEATIKNQPQGCKLEYRVKASNPAGESMPTNTVYAVL
jgi:hypothetical protein